MYQADGNPDEVSESLVKKLRNASYTVGDHSGKPIFNSVNAFSYLMFTLLYFPCVAVIAVVKKESGNWKWAAFMVIYTTTIAWVVAFLVNQIGNFIVG